MGRASRYRLRGATTDPARASSPVQGLPEGKRSQRAISETTWGTSGDGRPGRDLDVRRGGRESAANTIDPPGCENNGINLTIGRSPAIVHTGQAITYTVSVSNDDPTGTLKFCNVTGATVTITLPDPATGSPFTAGANTIVIASNHDFPVSGAGDIAPTSFTFTPPAGTTYNAATAAAAIERFDPARLGPGRRLRRHHQDVVGGGHPPGHHADHHDHPAGDRPCR